MFFFLIKPLGFIIVTSNNYIKRFQTMRFTTMKKLFLFLWMRTKKIFFYHSSHCDFIMKLKQLSNYFSTLSQSQLNEWIKVKWVEKCRESNLKIKNKKRLQGGESIWSRDHITIKKLYSSWKNRTVWELFYIVISSEIFIL